MKDVIISFFKKEDGLGTVEVVILIAVLVALALIFGKEIKNIVQKMLDQVTNDANSAIDEISGETGAGSLGDEPTGPLLKGDGVPSGEGYGDSEFDVSDPLLKDVEFEDIEEVPID